MVTLALAAAFLVSVTFTPLISFYVLRGQKGFDEGGEVRSFFLFRYVDQALGGGFAALSRRAGRLSEAPLAGPGRRLFGAGA